ncbi:centrosomal protein of 78 kDa [Scleropages formosus]|nr:centrosomal protein of 78 kDa [Scleropages formosus]
MLDSVQIRRRGALDFKSYYDYACALQDTLPVAAVKATVNQGVLDFSGDRLKLADWTPILHALAINKHLHHVAIRSSYQPAFGEPDRHKLSFRKRIPAFRSKDMTFQLCKAIRECLSISPSLRTLQLYGLPLRPRDLIILTKGLAKSESLEHLSLAYCPIADEGLETICQSVKYSTSIKTVDFTGCNLTWRGAEHMANIIKHQAMRRHSVAWAESLRYRKPQLESMSGLRRITLSCNMLIGDRGAAVLAQELAEDLWVKALDIQKCGLSNVGAKALLEALESNTTITVLDIRKNPLVDNSLIKAVIEKVLLNTDENSSQYSWIMLPSSKDAQKSSRERPTRISPNVGRGKPTFKIGSRRTSLSGRWSPCVTQSLHPGPTRHIPWRTAARAGRQRGIPQAAGTAEPSFQGASCVKITVETESESEEAESPRQTPVLAPQEKITVHQYKRLQVELEEYRLRLAEERKARLTADACLVELELENKRLRNINMSLTEAMQTQHSTSSALEDDAVLECIEASFRKFHAFLDLLKDAGLGELASIAGVDQADFGTLTRPQLTSTLGRGSAEEVDELAGYASSARNGLQAPSGNRPNGSIVHSDGLPEEYSAGQVITSRSCWPASVAEEFVQQRGPSPLCTAAHLASGSKDESCGKGSHGSNSHDNGSLEETSRRSRERSESLGSRGEQRRSQLSGSEEKPLSASEVLEQICSLRKQDSVGSDEHFLMM